jgi:subfamily B ATP-binding cassette protein MsbA
MRDYLRLLGYLGPYRRRLAAALFWMLVFGVMSGASLGMISPFMQVLFSRPSADGLAASAPTPQAVALAREPFRLDQPARWPELARARAQRALLGARPLVALERVCLVILLVLFLKNVADYLQGFLMVSVEQAALRDLRDELFARMQSLSLSFYHSRRTGALISRVTNDIEVMRQALAAGTSTFVKDVLSLLACLFWVFYISWRLALWSLLIVPPVLATLVALGRKMRKRSARTQERMADLTGILQEAIGGIRVVKVFGTEGLERRKFAVANRDYYRSFVRLRRISTASRPLGEFAIVLVATGMLWVGGREIFQARSVEPHQFFVFVAALLTTISPVKGLAEVNTQIQQGIAAGRRVFALLDAQPEVVERPGARELPPFHDRVRFEEVSFAYVPGRAVLHGLSFEIPRGQVIALVGSSGAGKSTAMDLVPRLYDPTGGRITVDGVDVREVTLASLRNQLAVVTQETFLFHDTVRANIAYGREGADEGAIVSAARAAYAHDFVMRLPKGYDTLLGERGVKLSGGERQRIAIARALLKNSPILLLDEATSSLDVESERVVQDALERLMADRTVLVIAHRLSTVQRADRILVLEGGRVVASGTHAELMEQQGLYRRLYEMQFVA